MHHTIQQRVPSLMAQLQRHLQRPASALQDLLSRFTVLIERRLQPSR